MSAPLGTGGNQFRDVARMIAAVDTLDGFLRDMRARYPESAAMSPHTPPAVPPASKPGNTSAAPDDKAKMPAKPGADNKQAPAKPSAAKPDPAKLSAAAPNPAANQTAAR